jgi:hypothetical protein
MGAELLGQFLQQILGMISEFKEAGDARPY